MRTTLLLLVLVFAQTESAALTVTADTRPETCNDLNGAAYGYAYGGVPPYTFAWTGPNGFTATTDSIFGLEGGAYSLIVTDNVGTMVTRNTTVDDLSELLPGTGGSYAGAAELTGYWGGACAGLCNGAMKMFDDLTSGTSPFNYNFFGAAQWIGQDFEQHPIYQGFCLGDNVNYAFSDALGCPGSGSFVVYGVDPSWYPVLDNIQGSCTASANGSVHVTMNNGPGFNVLLTVSLGGQFVASQTGYWGAEVTFEDLAPGTYDMNNTWSGTQCSYDQQFTIPDLGIGCGTVSGTSWYDINGDCIQDVGEVGIPNSILSVEPGGFYGITKADGSFTVNLPDGNYTLSQTDPTLVAICPPVQPVPFTMASAPVNIELANGSTAPLDLHAWASNTPARPGFNHSVYAHVVNTTPQLSGAVTATFTYDPSMTYLNATPTPTNALGNVLTWDFPAFGSFEARSINLQFNIPVSTPLGTVLSSTFNATQPLPEPNTANNTAVVTRTVTGSYDPNAKEVRTSSGISDSQYIIGTDSWLDYTIQFQNTGTDTAFTVVITDTLDAELNMASFEQGACSHPCTVDFKLGRVLEWTFADILLPDSTTNESASHGLTSFRIKLNEPVLPVVSIPNVANIYFDFNDPVITEPCLVLTELSTSVQARAVEKLRVIPNPADDHITFTGEAQPTQVRILAADGRTVLEQGLVGASSIIDVHTLSPGTYVALVHTADGVPHYVRFVKQ